MTNDTSILIKCAVVVWDKDGYVKAAEGQLEGKNIYKDLMGDAISPFIKTVKS